MLRPMQKITLSLAIAIAVVGFNCAYAAPSTNGDEMDKLLAEKSLLTQIDQVRQNVTSKASELVGNAMGLLGVPYKRGGNTAENENRRGRNR